MGWLPTRLGLRKGKEAEHEVKAVGERQARDLSQEVSRGSETTLAACVQVMASVVTGRTRLLPHPGPVLIKAEVWVQVEGHISGVGGGQGRHSQPSS